MIDLIYDAIQDEFGWESGVKFATSFSRGYIRTGNNLWYINIQNPRCLIPEDMINLQKTGKKIYGKDVLKTNPFPHDEEEILKINIGLSKKEAEEIASSHPQYLPLVDPHTCWTRFDFCIEHSVFQILKPSLLRFKEKIQPKKHVHIYGRYGGSGKTQILYSFMKECKKLSIPFIYRTEFWKDENGKYIEQDYNPENDSERVTEWVVTNALSSYFVLFLDEVDINLSHLIENLREKFSGEDPLVFIFSAAKEISPFIDENFEIYDIVKEYPFTESLYRQLLEKLLEISHVDNSIFIRESMDIIVKKTRLWNHSSFRRTPSTVILAASLSFIESIKLAEQNNQSVIVLPEIAEKWALLASSPWFEQHADLHDVHAEYLIYDGNQYVDVEKHYHLPLP